ncbi:MAG: class I SAM-dependent rRNA methyltransferase [Bdellovibrionales bacterium]|nr:class I SAM-dependent rRNA methyltransferase [Oligoflexia bacterium]
MKKIKSIRLKSKEERRFKQGHPWVFSNELQESPKHLELGELVELCDAGGAFLAYGFGNPSSLISFRELTREKNPKHVDEESGVTAAFFYDKFRVALQFRNHWFRKSESFRLVYGEADGLSGLIIDRFVGKEATVYVVQPHASGMDRNLPLITEALKKLSEELEDPSASIILRRDASSREREGLTKETPVVQNLKNGAVIDITNPFQEFRFQVPGSGSSPLSLTTDLISGQKTGFFFDQLENIRILEKLLERRQLMKPRKNFKILDLCSYIGQWSVHLADTLKRAGAESIQIMSVDVSQSALRLARENIEAAFGKGSGVEADTLKADVLEPMTTLKSASYDVVIADPPAFIKSRKSIPQGKQAYANLYQAAIEKTANGGIVVCCSCSQLLSHEDFLEVLGKASRRSQRKVRWLTEGSASFDHFSRLEFQEGNYLKSFMGQVSDQ